MMENNENEPLAAPFSQPEHRPLNDAERSLLEWLLAHGSPDARQYAPQLLQARVVGRCTCGCPTIDLAMGDRQQRTVGPSHVLADFEGITLRGSKLVSYCTLVKVNFQNWKSMRFPRRTVRSVFR